MSEIKITIADDHPVVRQGLIQIIESDAALKIIAEAADGRRALEQIAELKPDIAILDIDMPELDGLTVARAVGERELGVAIIFLTIHRDEAIFKAALDAGVKGYVLKDSAQSDIISSIKAVAKGQYYTSPALTTFLIRRADRRDSSTESKPSLADLTPTELRVLKLISEYKTSREIAEELFISPRTVDTHRSNMCQKLNLRGNYALMKFALAHKSDLD